MDTPQRAEPHRSAHGAPTDMKPMTDAPVSGTSMQDAVPTEAPAKPALSDPSELFTRSGSAPLPTRQHTFTRHDGSKVTVLLQGLTYLEKSEVDAEARRRREEDEANDTHRPSLWGPQLIARAMRKPTGARAYTEEHEWRAKAVALAEQFADGEINRAANAVLELSGYGKDAEEQAGK